MDAAPLERTELARQQLAKLNELLATILPANAFYREKFGRDSLRLDSFADLSSLPFTTKNELLPATGDDARNRTFALERYVRFHRTSGTRGRPLVVLDTLDDWRWWLDGWQRVLDAAELAPADRVFLAFSFGPFIGFWSAFDAAVARGALVIPSGGMSTAARLDLLRSSRATALFCTPSYALHLATVATQNGIDPRSFGVRKIVVAGEPGGSIPEVRGRLEAAWNATVIDHAGATEIGPWGVQAFSASDQRPLGLHVNETQFIAEFIARDRQAPARDGELSELVLTTLGRAGCPVIRYRTGDLVRPRWGLNAKLPFVVLDGGVLGRADDMLVIRGVNVFPSSIEAVVRGFPEVDEFRLIVHRDGAMDALAIEVEDQEACPERIAQELQLRIGLKVDVRCVPAGSLPRHEGKSQRFVDLRTNVPPRTN